MASAFAVTSQPGWSDRFEVTVYQLGWRLGGKCATSRNAANHNRIEEHGIHFLLGFYDNAFHVLRKTYDEYLPNFPSAFQSWRDAFRNQHTTTAMVEQDNQWTPFGITFAANSDLPGEDALFQNGAEPPSAWSFVAMVLKWMEEQLHAIHVDLNDRTETTIDPILGKAERTIPLLGKLLREEEDLSRQVRTVVSQQMNECIKSAYEVANVPNPPSSDSLGLQSITDSMTRLGELLVPAIETRTLGTWANQMLILLDVGQAVVRGVIADGVIWHGTKVIDDREFMDWLKSHGCHYTDSAVIRSGYDACFAYLGGNPARPQMSAAVGLHGVLRLWFTYRGSLYWPMTAGMAEVIFAPMYQVLQRRGVKFRFFHRVSHLGLSADDTNIETIDVDVQAVPKNGPDAYQPLIRVNGLDCWPDGPLYDQLQNGDAFRGFDLESAWAASAPVGQKRLVRGTDFDVAVLGISLGALGSICKDLVAARPTWQNMVARIPTVQTQAAQMWLSATAPQLGYSPGTIFPVTEPACVSGFQEPFDTYVDMTGLKIRESWKPSDHVTQIAYFCNVLQDDPQAPLPGTDPNFPSRMSQIVKQNTIAFLRRPALALWPGASAGTAQFNWDLLVDPTGGSAEARFDAQYWRSNIDPSARYVLSPPGGMALRLQPDNSGFANLFLAGDWTYTPMSSGCVEAATMSGLRAAQGVLGSPVPIYGWK